MSNEEELILEEKIHQFANIIIDKILSLTPEERKMLDYKIRKENQKLNKK